MSSANEIQHAASQLQSEDFARAYTHPFLAIRLLLDDEEAMFRTVVAGSSPQAQIKTEMAPLVKRAGANTFSFITIGRSSNNDVVIPANSVSKCHAVIQADGNDYKLSDAGSKNGTTLNGKQVGRNANVIMSPGDELSLSPQVTATFLDAKEAHAWLRRWR